MKIPILGHCNDIENKFVAWFTPITNDFFNLHFNSTWVRHGVPHQGRFWGRSTLPYGFLILAL